MWLALIRCSALTVETRKRARPGTTWAAPRSPSAGCATHTKLAARINVSERRAASAWPGIGILTHRMQGGISPNGRTSQAPHCFDRYSRIRLIAVGAKCSGRRRRVARSATDDPIRQIRNCRTLGHIEPSTTRWTYEGNTPMCDWLKAAQTIHALLVVLAAVGCFHFLIRTRFWFPRYAHYLAGVALVVGLACLAMTPPDAPISQGAWGGLKKA